MSKYKYDSELKLVQVFDQLIREDRGDIRSKRNMFLKSLFTFLYKQPYGILNQESQFNPFNREVKKIEIVLIPELIPHLELFFKKSKYIESCEQSKKSGRIIKRWGFDGENDLKIHFVTKFVSKGLHFFSTKKVLLNSQSNAYGIRQARIIDSLEYLFCLNQIAGLGITQGKLFKIMPSIQSQRVRLYNYLNLKYRQSITSIEQLTNSKPNNRLKALKVITNKTENKGGALVRSKLGYWRESLKVNFESEFSLSFPKIRNHGKRGLLQSVKTLFTILMGS